MECFCFINSPHINVSTRSRKVLKLKWRALPRNEFYHWITTKALPFSTLLWQRLCTKEGARFRHVSTGPLKRPSRFLILTLSGLTSGWPAAVDFVVNCHSCSSQGLIVYLRGSEPGTLCVCLSFHG